jgi:hypothetical protein
VHVVADQAAPLEGLGDAQARRTGVVRGEHPVGVVQAGGLRVQADRELLGALRTGHVQPGLARLVVIEEHRHRGGAGVAGARAERVDVLRPGDDRRDGDALREEVFLIQDRDARRVRGRLEHRAGVLVEPLQRAGVEDLVAAQLGVVRVVVGEGSVSQRHVRCRFSPAPDE